MIDFEPTHDDAVPNPISISEDAQDAQDEQADGAAPRKRKKRRSPPKSAAHEARIASYGRFVAERGWIFKPPTPEKSISSLFEHLTVKQIVGLGNAVARGA